MNNRSTREILEDMEEDSFYVWMIKSAIKLFFAFCICVLFLISVVVATCYMCSD